VEEQLIEAMILKMQMIQFVSSSTLMQMRLRKVIDTPENMMNQEFQHFMEEQLIEVMQRKM
jgi:hypothetical protein